MPAGRPTLMDKITLKKLEDAFSNGASDVEACFLANISHQTLYNYQDKFPEFVERKTALKEMIKYQAKTKVKKTIEKELGCDTAKWYLERRDKDFKSKSDMTSDDKALTPLLVKFLEDEQSNTDNHRDSI